MAADDPLDLRRLCATVDEALQRVREWAPGDRGPTIRDWNDLLFVTAFTRAFRCMWSIRELAGRGEADDAAVLTRSLCALVLRYLWLARVDDEDERNTRRRRLVRKWAEERATLGEELEDLDYLARGTAAPFREAATRLAREGIAGMPTDRDIAIQLDRELQLDPPRFLELVYARVYRTTSDVAHYGIGAALVGLGDLAQLTTDTPIEVPLEAPDEERAAEALGLALVVYGAFIDLSEPVIAHGLSQAIAGLVDAHRGVVQDEHEQSPQSGE